MEERPSYLNDRSRYVLLLPAVLMVLLLSVFPLLISVYTSLSRIKFVKGGFKVTYIGTKNYKKLLEGSGQRRFLGRFDDPSTLAWIVLFIFLAVMIYWLFHYLTGTHRQMLGFVGRAITIIIAGRLLWLVHTTSGGRNLRDTLALTLPLIVVGGAAYITGPRKRLLGFILRIITIVIAGRLLWLVLVTSSGRGLPGTLEVTLILVFGGVTIQYILGLFLALLVTQNLPGRRFFRVVFLLPMMITPVGIGFLFRMLTDTLIGPIAPLWEAAGLYNFSWVDNPTYARLAVIIGDTWQWTPFIFIILLAALEGLPPEIVEAALVDGANRQQLFRYIILPQIIPVSTTLILVRLIEAFKMIDMPNALTGGGPGIATETVTLHIYNLWRGIDLGTSSALAYCLLFVVTFVALVFVNFIRQRLLESI